MAKTVQTPRPTKEERDNYVANNVESSRQGEMTGDDDGVRQCAEDQKGGEKKIAAAGKFKATGDGNYADNSHQGDMTGDDDGVRVCAEDQKGGEKKIEAAGNVEETGDGGNFKQDVKELVFDNDVDLKDNKETPNELIKSNATDSLGEKSTKKPRLDDNLCAPPSGLPTLSSMLSDLKQKFRGKRPKSPVHSIPMEFCTRKGRQQYMTEWILRQEKKAETHTIDHKWFDDAIDMVKDGRAKLLVENGYNMFGEKLREGHNFFDKNMAEEYEMYDWIPKVGYE